MRKLTMMKRITDLRDDFIEEAYLPEAVPVLPVKPHRTIPVLGIPFALAGKIAAASVAGIALIGVVFGIAIPALRDRNPSVDMPPAVSDMPSDELDPDDPYEDTEPASNGEIRVTITPKLARPGETVAILIEPSAGTGAADRYRLYFTYATTPVGADLLAYTAEPTGHPSLYTVTIPQNAPVVRISSADGSGFDALVEQIHALYINENLKTDTDAVVFTARQHEALRQTAAHLSDAALHLSDGWTYDLCAEDIRSAMEALGQLDGRSTREDVISEIFSRFCVGK